MKLAIIIFIYALMVAVALALLWGPLKSTVKRGRHAAATRGCVLACLIILFFLPVLGAVTPDGAASHGFHRVGNVYLGFVAYFFGPLFLIQMGHLIYRLVRGKRPLGTWGPKGARIALILCLALTLGLNGWGMWSAQTVRTTRYAVEKTGISAEDPLRIALIADLHMGVNSHEELYEDMVEAINREEPDLVLVAGDIVTSSYSAMKNPDRYAKILSGIESRYGCYVVYGNHDVDEPLLGGFTYDKENAERNPELVQFLKDCNWRILADDVVEVKDAGVTIIGRRDLTRPGDGIKERMSLGQLAKKARAGETDNLIISLEHEPVEYEAMSDLGIDLVVSGHTHNGQTFPGNIWGKITGPQCYGIKEWGHTTAIVTSGVGFFGPPIRVGTISEVVIIDITGEAP